MASDACPDLLDRVSFTPGQIEKALPKLQPAMNAAAGAAASGEDYSPRSPFAVDDRQKAWRLIGRGYAWKAAAAIDGEDWAAAATACADAHRFAAALSRGDVGDASIGLASAAEVRQLVAPRLAQMPPEALRQLAEGMEKALAALPQPADTLNNEAKRAKLAVQHLQDQFAKGEIDAIKADYGRTAKNSITRLSRLDHAGASGFFQGLAAEADVTAAWTAAQAETPVARRSREPSYGPGARPWDDFSHHIYAPMGSFIQMRDIAIARGRLLILSARIESQIKSMGKAPASLGIYGSEVRTDPFTGEDFRYRSAAEEYRLYSVGEDGSDSGGDSDDSGLTPDLVLDR